MTAAPDFTETELAIVHDTVAGRYGKPIEIRLADAEIRPDPAARTLVTVPAVFWSERRANFIVFKLGKDQYRPQFFYRGYEQFGTGRDLFHDIGDCVTAVLQVQADHERQLGEESAA
jgi:hypothetical protein